MTDHLFLADNSAANIAGTGANRMTLLKKTCSDPMMIQDFLLCSSHFPGGWHMLIQPASDHMYQMEISPMEHQQAVWAMRFFSYRRR